MNNKQNIDCVNSITPKEFHDKYVKKNRPVLIKGLMEKWRALNWDTDYLKSVASNITIGVKQGDVSDGVLKNVALKDYLNAINATKSNSKKNNSDIGYLHDVPLFYFIPELVKEVDPFPKELIPKWYWLNWQNYAQFFIGPKDSVTPLHFDTLGTNNLFFQIAGEKEFTLIAPEQKKFCYMNSWRWSKFDPSRPDYETYPLTKKLTPVAVRVEAGDVLYMPSYTLHHVRSLSDSISFNIDWHTSASAKKGVFTIFKGAPIKNGYYNLMLYLGLGLGIPEKYIYPRLKSYMSYVS